MTETTLGFQGALSRERRSELLALAEPDALVALAERCIDGSDTRVTAGPEVGMVVLQVREPVEATRFHLGEVLVTRAEVIHGGVRGWARRAGDEPLATVAAAVCDAEAAADGPLRPEIDVLCHMSERAERERRAAEWAELEATIVDFEELDR
jgi:alpha-D-ribose 1-methylphosphonate 5-triphosphate synthase subunit PhnG